MYGDQSGKFVCGNNWELKGSGTLYMYSGQVSILKSQCLLMGCKNDFPRKPFLFALTSVSLCHVFNCSLQ